MVQHRGSVKDVLIGLSVLLLTGCAWASRNIYREPLEGDAGSFSVVRVSSTKRMNVWIFADPTHIENVDDGKAIAVFSDLPEKTVRVLHKDLYTVSLNLISSQYVGGQTQVDACQGLYDVPFPKGDMRITLIEKDGNCSFVFERKLDGQNWERATDVRKRERPGR